MNWRKLLLRMSVRFMAIVREENAEEKDHAHCFIIDDTTLEKTGSCMEGISRLFDHVTTDSSWATSFSCSPISTAAPPYLLTSPSTGRRARRRSTD
jgi:hypothetical protein